MKEFNVHAFFDAEAQVWVGENDQLPLVTEADTLEHLLDRTTAIAPEIAYENGLVEKGDHVTIHLIADRKSAAA